MSYQASTIADWFLIRAASDGEALTNMKLHKLVYIAHGWNLGIFSKPLISEPIEAWRFGPVVRSLYRRFVEYGSHSLPLPASVPSGINPDTLALLEKVWNVYKGFSASQLSAMTHADGTPWKQSYYDEKPPRQIPDGLIQQYYAERVAKK